MPMHPSADRPEWGPDSHGRCVLPTGLRALQGHMLPIGRFLLSHLSPGVNMYQWRRRRLCRAGFRPRGGGRLRGLRDPEGR
jgi:hypothetical protein